MTTEKRIEILKKRHKLNLQWADLFRSKRMNYPFEKFVRLMPYMAQDSVASLTFVPCPAKFCGKDVPQDLALVTFGILTRLQQAPNKDDFCETFCNLVSVLLDVPAEKVRKCKAVEVIGIVNMIQSEMERIGKLFKSLQSERTSDELAAGIDRLEFGTFGILDWYAKRMGIIDHEDVFATPWARIYKCMEIDHENGEFEKRYRKVLENRSRRK